MHTRARGVTLFEILIVIAVALILSAVTLRSLGSLATSKTLDSETNKVVAELERARSLTVGSRYGQVYGVHIVSTSTTLFQGSSYDPASATNTVMKIDPRISISSVDLDTGGADIVFARLSGGSSASGTVRLINGSTSLSRTIHVYSTGVVEIQ